MPGKFPTFGFETEFFIIDEEGNLINKSDDVINLLKDKKRIYNQLRKEAVYSMLEFGAYPGRKLKKVELRYLENLRTTIDLCGEEGIKLLPLTGYPAKSRPKMNINPWYAMQAKFFGKQKFSRAMLCAFHFHYSLPKGLVEKSTTQLRSLRYSRAREIFLNQYNFLIAADPACITFCQSSPFIEGEHFAKDARTLLYRDMVLEEKGKKIYGLYAEYPLFGGLPNYEYTLADLRKMSAERKEAFLAILHSKGMDLPPKVLKRSNLRFMWGSVRINRVGTIEYRGTDMNHPSYIFSTAYLLKLALNTIKSQNLQMLPSDIGLKEPFKREGDVVYLPPFSRVKSIEKCSTLYGFESKRVHNYCSALFNFVVKNAKRKNMKKLKTISKMLREKKTVSDEILKFVRKKGYKPDDVPNEVLKEVALVHSARLSKDVDETIKLLSR